MVPVLSTECIYKQELGAQVWVTSDYSWMEGKIEHDSLTKCLINLLLKVHSFWKN